MRCLDCSLPFFGGSAIEKQIEANESSLLATSHARPVNYCCELHCFRGVVVIVYIIVLQFQFQILFCLGSVMHPPPKNQSLNGSLQIAFSPSSLLLNYILFITANLTHEAERFPPWSILLALRYLSAIIALLPVTSQLLLPVTSQLF